MSTVQPDLSPALSISRHLVLKITVAYVICGLLWIFLSGYLLHFLVREPSASQAWELGKGVLFVFVTGGLLGLVLARNFRRIRDAAIRTQNSERRMRQLFDNLPSGLARFRLVFEDGKPTDFEFLEVNSAFEKITGFGNVLGRRASQVVPGIRESNPVPFETCVRVGLTGNPEQFETYVAAMGNWFSCTVFSAQKDHFTTVFEIITERKIAEEKLRASNAKLQAALSSMTDAVFLSDCDGRFVEFNDAFATFHKFGSKDECAKTLNEYPAFLEVFLPNGDLAPLEKWAVPRALRGESAMNEEYTLRRKDTGDTWVGSYSFAPIRGIDGGIMGCVVAGRDITERKRVEEHVWQLNQLLIAIRDINKLIVREREPQKMLMEACATLQQMRGYLLVWIGEPGSDSNRVIPVAWAGPRSDYLSDIVVTTDNGPTGTGPTGSALRTRQPWVCQDAATDPRFVEWREAALARGYRSVVAVPIIHRDRLFGAISVYADHAGAFDAEEVGLLTELSSDLAFALDSIEHEEKRQNAEAALLEREEQLRLFIEHSPAAVAMFDCEMRYLLASQRWMDDYGLGRDSLIGRSHYEIFPEIPQRWKDVHQRCLAGATERCDEDSFIRANGEKTWVDWKIRPWRKSDGLIGGIILFSEDVTRRKEKAEEHARLAKALEQAAEAVLITNARGEITYVNPAFERITGYRRADVMGENPRILKSERQDGNFYANLWKTLEARQVWSGRLTNKRKDGSIYEAELTISPVTDEHQNVMSYVALQRDISEQRELERRLQQAQKLEAIGTLAGGIAHDFNNILAAIMGYGQLVMDRIPEDSHSRADMDALLSAGVRAAELVRQILTFSRQVEEERNVVEVGRIVKEALKILRPSLPSTIEIHTKIFAGNCSVLADPTQIHQVIMNLCTNAYHAMREKGGSLTVVVEPLSIDHLAAELPPDLTEGDYVRLSVTDTGHGIRKEDLDRIFDPFFTTKSVGQGTGLGLATVHGIVKSHGGTISVCSEVGEGAAFHVYLPQTALPTQAAEDVEATIPGGNERILVVDDEPALARFLERALSQLGYRVTSKTAAGDALEAFHRNPNGFDLVITDQTMPKMTGVELAAQLKQVRADLPTIITTGHMDALLREEFATTGAAAILLKPAKVRDIARTVRKAIDNVKASVQNTSA